MYACTARARLSQDLLGPTRTGGCWAAALHQREATWLCQRARPRYLFPNLARCFENLKVFLPLLRPSVFISLKKYTAEESSGKAVNAVQPQIIRLWPIVTTWPFCWGRRAEKNEFPHIERHRCQRSNRKAWPLQERNLAFLESVKNTLQATQRQPSPWFTVTC